MTKPLIVSLLLVLLYRRVLDLWESQRPGAAFLTAFVLAGVGLAALSEVVMFADRTLEAVTRLG